MVPLQPRATFRSSWTGVCTDVSANGVASVSNHDYCTVFVFVLLLR